MGRMSKAIHRVNPELTLKPSERRKRAKLMARITTGSNALTRRQIRRLPGYAGTGHWLLKRMMRKQGLSAREVFGG
jgi:hypothetical protein